MTVICYDGRTLAADSRMTHNNMITTDSYNKIHVFNEPIEYMGDVLLVAGLAGCVTDSYKIVYMLETKQFPTAIAEKEPEHEVNAIIVGRDYVYELEDSRGWLIRYDKKTQLVAGSGHKFAKSALAFGLDAVGAVKHTIKLCCYCGGKVRTWSDK